MSKKNIEILSFFDGCSCLQIAINKLNVVDYKYYAAEIDKYAMKVTKAEYPNTIQLGDVVVVRKVYSWKQSTLDKLFNSQFISDSTKLKFKELVYLRSIKFDLFAGGSPCQGFSFAGKQLNFSDPRSKLFFEFSKTWEAIKKKNPRAIFLLENVRMKKKFENVISEIMGVNPLYINSNLVSAQNRYRLYWCNIQLIQTSLFGRPVSSIPQPRDKQIFLKDILQPENEVDEKYYIKNPKIGFEGIDIAKKTNTLRSSGHNSQSNKHNFNIIKLDKNGNNKNNQNKAGCLTDEGHSGGNHSDMDIICVSMVGRKIDKNGVRKDYDKSIKAKQRLEPKTDGKTNCLTSVQKDNLILQNDHGHNKGGLFEGKSPTLLSNSWEHNNHVLSGFKLRRLTPIECERLQTIPDNYTNHVSNSQRYKILGNGWTVDVIAHILSYSNINKI